MFIEKVAYITQEDLPEEFHEKVDSTVYYDDSDGAYFEISIKDKRDPLFALMDMEILTEKEAKELVDEEVAYIMMYVPA